MPIRKLVGERCYLAPISGESADIYFRWDNDLEVAIPLGDEAYIATTLESSRADLEGAFKSKSHIYDIVTLEKDQIIGRCMLFRIDPTNRCGHLGIVIGEKDYWDKGYGSDAMQLLLEYGFHLLNLHNVTLGVFSYNKRALGCYKKVGFKEVGRRREVRIIGDRKFDLIIMDILSHELEVKFLKDLLDGLNEN